MFKIVYTDRWVPESHLSTVAALCFGSFGLAFWHVYPAGRCAECQWPIVSLRPRHSPFVLDIKPRRGSLFFLPSTLIFPTFHYSPQWLRISLFFAFLFIVDDIVGAPHHGWEWLADDNMAVLVDYRVSMWHLSILLSSYFFRARYRKQRQGDLGSSGTDHHHLLNIPTTRGQRQDNIKAPLGTTNQRRL